MRPPSFLGDALVGQTSRCARVWGGCNSRDCSLRTHFLRAVGCLGTMVLGDKPRWLCPQNLEWSESRCGVGTGPPAGGTTRPGRGRGSEPARPEGVAEGAGRPGDEVPQAVGCMIPAGSLPSPGGVSFLTNSELVFLKQRFQPPVLAGFPHGHRLSL